jgi:hypothetical protein
MNGSLFKRYAVDVKAGQGRWMKIGEITQGELNIGVMPKRVSRKIQQGRYPAYRVRDGNEVYSVVQLPQLPQP